MPRGCRRAAPRLALWLAIGTTALGAPVGASGVETWLQRQFGVAANVGARVTRGDAVATPVDAADPREVALLGAVGIAASPEAYITRLQDIASLKRGPQVEAIGVFSAVPAESDLVGLHLTAEEARSLRDCRAGDCDLQVTATTLDAVQDARSGGRAALTTAFRRGLLDLVQRYLRGGVAALPAYVDDEPPVRLHLEARDLIDSERRVLGAMPTWRQRLLDGGTPSTGTSAVLYWSRERIGRASVVSVTHMVMAPAPEVGPGVWMAVSLQLYASHYFDASLGITLLWPEGAGSTLVYYNRSRVDTFGGLFGGMLRRMVRSRARAAMRAHLTAVQQRFGPRSR